MGGAETPKSGLGERRNTWAQPRLRLAFAQLSLGRNNARAAGAESGPAAGINLARHPRRLEDLPQANALPIQQDAGAVDPRRHEERGSEGSEDRKSTRLNS